MHDKDSAQDRRFAVLSVRHTARNNLDEDLKRAADEQLGQPALDGARAEGVLGRVAPAMLLSS